MRHDARCQRSILHPLSSILRIPQPFRSALASALLLILAACLQGCDLTNSEPFEREVVVESYLVVGERLPPVRLTRLAAIDELYNARRLAVRGADVRVELLAEDGNAVETTYRYELQGDSIYVPAEPFAERVLPLRRYRLVADVPSAGEDAPAATVRSTTLTPGAFDLVRATADTVTYQSPDQLELTVTPSTYPTREQSFYIFSSQAEGDLTVDRLVPFLRDILEDDDEPIEQEDLEEFRISSSPIINEENYARDQDGNITIALAWIAVVYYGPNTVRASVLDDNLYDFYRSQFAQGGGSTLQPGEIPNVLDRVENGTGVFGSLAEQSYEVYVREP